MKTRDRSTNEPNDTNKKSKGFTLIEIMVASSIFIILMVMAVGAVLSLVDGNRKAQALSSVISNLSISLDSMVRDIRTGTAYQVPSKGGSNINFINTNGDSTTYSVSPNRGFYSIHKTVTRNGVTILDGDMTAPEVQILNMEFTASGVGQDGLQPRVLLQIIGNVGTGKYASPFTIQTLIEQRVLEN